jgi:hypothetical protein
MFFTAAKVAQSILFKKHVGLPTGVLGRSLILVDLLLKTLNGWHNGFTWGHIFTDFSNFSNLRIEGQQFVQCVSSLAKKKQLLINLG